MTQKNQTSFNQLFFWTLAFLLALGAVCFWLLPSVPVLFRRSQPSPVVTEKIKTIPVPVAVPPPETKVTEASLAKEHGGRRPTGRKVASKGSAGKGDHAEDLTKAIGLVDDGKWQVAEAVLGKILQDDPNHEDALIEMAMLNLLDKKDGKAALPFMERALKVNVNNEAMVSEYLAVNEELGTTGTAIDFLKKQAQEQPNADELDLGLAHALIQTGRQEEAVEFLQRSAEVRTGWEKDEVLEQLGDAYLQMGQSEQALESWREIIERQKGQIEAAPEDKVYLKEQSHHVRLKYAEALVKAGQNAEAESVVGELEKDHPNDDNVLSLRSTLKQRGM